jgi:hypothetical protein
MSTVKAVQHQVGNNATDSKNIVLTADVSTGDLVISKGVYDGTLTEISRIMNAGGGAQYVPAGTGAVATTVQTKLRESVSVKDFGVVGNGITDDTVAFNLARAAAVTAKLPLLIFGTPKITSQLTITSKEHWIFQGTIGNSSGSRPSSYLVKASTVLGDFITITASNTLIEFGGIYGQVGNTGDGYVIKGNNVVLMYPYVEGCGQDGIRVGSDTPGSGINANSFQLISPTSSINGRHGIHLSDGDITLPSNANAGYVVHPLVQNNTLHGIYVNQSAWTTIIGPLAESNTGYGINLGPLSQISIFGGDSEQNVAGSLFQTNQQNNKIYDLDCNGLRYTSLLDYAPIAPATSGKDMVLNGNFANSSIWTLFSTASISGGLLSLPANTSAGQKITTVKGNSYTIQVTITTAASRNIVRVGSTGPGSFNLINAGYLTTAGVFEYTFVALSENTWIQCLNDSSSSGTSQIGIVKVIGNITSNGTISPRMSTTALAPAYVKGAMYFDTTLNKLRIGGATAWETVTSV